MFVIFVRYTNALDLACECIFGLTFLQIYLVARISVHGHTGSRSVCPALVWYNCRRDYSWNQLHKLNDFPLNWLHVTGGQAVHVDTDKTCRLRARPDDIILNHQPRLGKSYCPWRWYTVSRGWTLVRRRGSTIRPATHLHDSTHLHDV